MLIAGSRQGQGTTPTTDDNRLPTVLKNTSGFVYYVSIMGITGTKAVPSEQVREAVTRLRRHTELPIAVGFGIRTPEQAAAISGIADGAVVGSAIVDAVKAELDENGKAKPGLAGKVLALVESLANGVRGTLAA